MRRIETVTGKLSSVGDYAKVILSIEDTTGEKLIEGVLARLAEDVCAFSSNDALFFGNNVTGSYDEFTWLNDEFSYSWVIIADDLDSWKLSDICTPSGFNTSLSFKFCGVITEDNTKVFVSGRRPSVTQRVDEDFFDNNYERTSIYTGIKDYHRHHGEHQNNMVNPKSGYRIGVELEVEFNRSGERESFSRKKSNWFYLERDGSLNSNGVEIITVPMHPSHIKKDSTWDKLIGYLEGKAVSWDSSRCGLHVHIGREILGSNPEQQSETTGKLLFLYHFFLNGTSMNTKIFGRASAYNEKDGKTASGKAAKDLGSAVFKVQEVKDKVKTEIISHNRSDRYFDINLSNANTIEFRKGRGSIKTSRIVMVVEYCELMCKYAKATSWDKISKESFVEYIVTKVSKKSPLYRFFERGERCGEY